MYVCVVVTVTIWAFPPVKENKSKHLAVANFGVPVCVGGKDSA